MSNPGPTGTHSPYAWILAMPGSMAIEIWGLSPTERLRRSLDRSGCEPIDTLGPDEALDAPREGVCLLARADRCYDGRLVEALAKAPGPLLVDATDGAAEPVAACVEASRAGEALAWIRERRAGAPPGLRATPPGALASGYIALLRKYQAAYLLPARPETARRVEELTFDAAYKGATDLVTKWVWPRPARAATRWLAERAVHPNSVTVASWVLAIAAGALFAQGSFGMGLVGAWVLPFLDTVDGEPA